jgi:hypothetical protein
MANTFQKILGKGKEPVTEREEEWIFNMLLNGRRKSAVLNTMLGQGFDKLQSKATIEEQSRKVKKYKKSKVGIKEMVEINKKRSKNGMIAIVSGVILTIVLWNIPDFWGRSFDYAFSLFILWGIYSFARGSIGILIFKIKERENQS